MSVASQSWLSGWRNEVSRCAEQTVQLMRGGRSVESIAKPPWPCNSQGLLGMDALRICLLIVSKAGSLNINRVKRTLIVASFKGRV
jgi:hypothetical protein